MKLNIQDELKKALHLSMAIDELTESESCISDVINTVNRILEDTLRALITEVEEL